MPNPLTPTLAELRERLDEICHMPPDPKPVHPLYQLCVDALTLMGELEGRLVARTQQVERWQHAAHEGCSADADGKLLCPPASPGDFARAIHQLRAAQAEGALLRRTWSVVAELLDTSPSLLALPDGERALAEARLALRSDASTLSSAIGALVRAADSYLRGHRSDCEQYRVLGDPLGSVAIGGPDGPVVTGKPWHCFCGHDALKQALAAAPLAAFRRE